MSTATQSGMASDRIPLHVIHGNQGAGLAEGGAYDLRGMGDETDRIKVRMKEFEERCKRWREEFFVKSQHEHAAPFADSASLSQHAPACCASPPFASSLHKSYIEDTENGAKVYKIEFDIGDFKQNELQISTKGKGLVVKGDREVRVGSSTETKTFNRELTVPDYVDLECMSAFLLDKRATNSDKSVLVLEAPIFMDKYAYRRSAFDKSQPPSQPHSFFSTPVHTAPQAPSSPPHQLHHYQQRNQVVPGSFSESHHVENKSSSASHSHTTSSKKILGHDHFSQPQHQADFFQPAAKSPKHTTQLVTPELISGYPVYDNKEGCVVYKFDFSGFDQSEIHLTITVERTLEIKAVKQSQDHLGKVYREFKREIQLEPEVDAGLIKNLLYEGVLTLKIPKPNRLDGSGSVSNQHNLHSPNGFREFYTDDGKLAKLTSDFKGFSPDNVKIVLSANNVLKLTAFQEDTSAHPPHSKGTVKKECSRQYTLPAWVQPEQMRAIMSRDGVLTVDFTGRSVHTDDRIHIN